MKKIFTIFLAVVLISAAFYGCGDNSPENVPKAKQELLFLIDEGISGNDITSKYKNDYKTMDEYLNNIFESCKPLLAKYDVSFLIYPNWHYNENGYGEDATNAINRISPELKHALDIISLSPYKVYLELYSSGGYTNQNGELGNLPFVPLNYGDTEKRKSIPMDMQALSALSKAYPCIKGVRFHELIGTNIQSENGHGFKVETDVIYAIADTCKANNLVLAWGDHSWALAYNSDKYEWWQEVIENVSKKLGNKLILNSSNNSIDVMTSLNFKKIFDDEKHGRRWGVSCQSWFWFELEKRTTGEYKPDGYMDMPGELMAAFTLQAFKRGAALVQYENVAYYFNSNYPPNYLNGKDQLGFYEVKPDYTGTKKLDILIEMLLTDDLTKYPSINPADYYTDGEDSLFNDLEAQKPKQYNQSTLSVLNENGELISYERYVSNPDEVFVFNCGKYRKDIFSKDVEIVERIDLSYNQFDDLIVVKNKNGVRTAEFYNTFNALIYENSEIFADNDKGKFVNFTTLNLESKVVFNSSDSAEIIVAREKDNKINFTVYKAISVYNENPRKAFKIVEAPELSEKLNAMIDVGSLTKDNYYGIQGLRSRNALFPGGREAEDGILLFKKENNKFEISGSMSNIALSKTVIDVPNKFIGFAVMDYDFDSVEELVICADGKAKIYGFDQNSLYNLNKSFDISSGTKVFGTRTTTHYNAF